MPDLYLGVHIGGTRLPADTVVEPDRTLGLE